MLDLIREMVREIMISEEIGRNFHTIHTDPISYSDFVGYDVESTPTLDGKYVLNVYFNDEKLIPTRTYNTKEEADLYARKVVEKHRLASD